MINLQDIKKFQESKEKFDNRYVLVEKIGGGGFSEVWLAHDTNAGIDVALKIYTPNGDLDAEGKEDFRREFARLCGLNHSNIIHAIGFGIHNEELPYLVMSVCKNGSSKKLIKNYEEEELWDFIEQVTLGLKYLHSHDITHQDIKPDNILINSDGQYLIIDFGISTKTRNTLRRTDKGSVGGGTPWYMSSESYKPESSDIHARDIWAFGATLYEIITGDVPFGQYGGLTQQAQKGKIPPISNEISDELKEIVYDCLALESWNRPSADKILERVELHKAGVRKGHINYKKILIGVVPILLIVLWLLIIKPGPEPKVDMPEQLAQNDSMFLEKLNEAIVIAQPEISKKNLSTVNEEVLCSAAQIYADATELEVTDSIKAHGEKTWASSQEIIDKTYEFLHDRGIYYRDLDAEEASRDFNQRCLRLSKFVTPSKIKS